MLGGANPPGPARRRGLRGRRSLLLRIAVVGASIASALLLLEVVLRVSPSMWPTGAFGVGRYDAELGLNVHAASAVYNKVRWVRRKPNRAGFLDVDHEAAKPPGVLRVGFFGDSYVEGLQVPLESTFFRRLPPDIDGRPIEPLGFGISGWGTLHALMAYEVLGPRYDLDVVVYVFVKNDPGDNYYPLQTARRGSVTVKPSAELSETPPGYTIHRPEAEIRDTLWRRFKRALDAHSMLARVVRGRLQLLEANRVESTGRAGGSRSARSTSQNDPPSLWPPAMLEEARELTRRLLTRFRDRVAADGREFAVLYVPRGNLELEGRIPDEDLWIPWLRRTCEELDITLLDPTAALRAAHSPTSPMYDDHWSAQGHAVIAEVVADYLRGLPPTTRGGGGT